MSHAVAYGAVCFFLLFVAGFKTAFIVALAWGIGLVSHFFGALVAPDLRRRYVEREVARQVQRTAPAERRNLEERHVRSLEELSASIAHEIRNPITAAKSLVQQMGEDPASARERRVREGRARGARPRRALGGAPAALRARGGDPHGGDRASRT